MSDDKSHDATPQRRNKAREEGQVAKSQDLAASMVLLFGIVLLMTYGRKIAEIFRVYTEKMLSEPRLLHWEIGEDQTLFDAAQSLFYATVLTFLGPLSLFFLALLAIAIVGNIAQIGFLWLPNKLTFDITKLDPIKGLQRIFSMQSVIRLLMGIIKIVICAIVAYYAVKNEIGAIINMTAQEEQQIASYLVWVLLNVALKVAVALCLIAILDFMYQKWKHEQDIRMSHQELRDEMKNMQGDPQVMSKRRQLQREMATQQRAAGTSDADVVVTNPTHFAVAIKFDPHTMHSPVVVAKGTGFLAQKIKEIAKEHHVPIVENKPLARALYAEVDIGQPILDSQYHRTLYRILDYAYSITGRNLAEEFRRSQQNKNQT